MTFSIVACDLRAGSWGVAVASRYLAVGGIVPAARSGAGALATQARTNMAYREQGIAALGAGRTASAVLADLLGSDDGCEQRQVGIVDATGGSATWTGSQCEPYAGGRDGSSYAVQGNMLVGPEVLDAMVHAWSGSSASSLGQRLLEALASGDAAGGDRRGRQAAGLLVVRRGGGYRIGSDVEVDLRVDDAPRPVEELRRLLGLHSEQSTPA